jgi:ATP-binding cassette subfamily B protein IrtA
LKHKEFIKGIKSKNKASSVYMVVNVIAGLVTVLLAVWMVSLFRQGEASQERLIGICAAICLFQIVKAVFYATGIWKAHYAAYHSLADIRMDIVNHMKKLPIRFFQKKKTGDLSNIINHDVEQVEIFLAHAQPEILISILMVAAISVALFIVDWRIGLAMFIPMPVMIVYQSICNRFQSKIMNTYVKSTKEMNEDLVEYIGTMPAIKAFSNEEKRTSLVLRHMKDYIKWIKNMMFSISGPQSIGQLIMEIGIVLVVIVGSSRMVNGDLSVTSFILCIVLANLCIAFVMKYMSFHHANVVLGASAASIYTIMSETPEEDYPENPNLHSGNVELKNVSFSYDGRDEALHNISLTFRENTVNALVGSSGSGKSTIANLIMGFWKAGTGTISIGGQNIAKMNSRDLSTLVSIVQQESFLFNTTIAENIRIGKENATIDEVIAVAKMARIHDMVQSLPDGYNTIVGEGGAKLSGGEKQRIAIARIMLKNSPIVILDEATAAIDPHNEYLIQEAISNLSRDKTVISIAHHLRTIVNVDQIVVMDGGKVAAAGTHHELMQSCSLYSDMVRAQDEVDHWEIKEKII